MSKLTAAQRKKIYGIAIQLGIYEKDNKEDDLHGLVYRETKKSSIGDLTQTEADKVISKLVKYTFGNSKRSSGKVQKENKPGMITPEMSKKVWALMYQLSSYDKEPSMYTLGFRLSRIVEKEIGITPFDRKRFHTDPLDFLNFQQGNKLIEKLKMYLENEKRKAKKGSEANDSCNH